MKVVVNFMRLDPDRGQLHPDPKPCSHPGPFLEQEEHSSVFCSFMCPHSSNLYLRIFQANMKPSWELVYCHFWYTWEFGNLKILCVDLLH